MSQAEEPREVYPVQFFDKRQPIPTGKDFSIYREPSDAPELEPAAEEVVEEADGPDPKGSSATESAQFSDLIPSAAEVIPVNVETDPEPTTTDLSRPTSSTSPATGRSEQPVVPAAVTTPSSGSEKPQKRATKRS